MQRPIRVVLAAPAAAPAGAPRTPTARRLRDAGMEVIDTGVHEGAEGIAGAAVREDADVVALASPGGAGRDLVPGVLALLQARGARDVVVLVDADAAAMAAGSAGEAA